MVKKQEMTGDGKAEPTLTFNPAVALFLKAGDGIRSSSMTGVPTSYLPIDANVLQSDVTIDVSGAKDANGNGQTDYTPQAEFSIDTANPSVTSVTAKDRKSVV